MYCSNCENKINEGDVFCANCGTEVTKQSEALEKFYSIKNHVQSHRDFLDTGESEKSHTPEELAHMAMYKAYDEEIREKWGDKFTKKSHDIDDKADILKILQDEFEAKRISDDELQEIFNSEDFQVSISLEEMVLAVKDHTEKLGNSPLLKQIKKYQDRAKKTKADFIGRHQELIAVRQALGESVSPAENQVAIEKDIEERNQALQQIQDLEIYVNSDLFVAHEGSHITEVNKMIRKIIEDGYDTCVLQNDRELDERCFKIVRYMDECAENLFLKKGKPVPPEIIKAEKETPSLLSLGGFFKWSDLGKPKLLDTAEQQQAWLMITSLLHPEKQIGVLNANNYLTQIVASMSLKNLENYVGHLRTMRKRLSDGKKISDEYGRKIDDMIEQGLIENKKIHDQYPDRP